MASSSANLAGSSASDLLRSSASGFTCVPLRSLGSAGLVLKKRDLTVNVTAKLKKYKRKPYPWPKNPDPKLQGGDLLIQLSHFKPLKEKPKPVTLDFEKPLVDLQKKIDDVRKMASETGLDFSDQISNLENKYQQALTDLYTHLTPIQRVYIARHPNRPTCLDHIFNITEKFVELHGDRKGYDDPAIVCGLGTMEGRTYMFIGHQKGRNTKESIERNFGMPTPHGYRKALRLMEYADHHGFPIVTFIDTPGAYADLKSEELNQGEAIAQNLRSMFGLKVPVICIVIGEGGSGGALAIGCGNKMLMLDNSVFYVASPEACAAILWKSAKAAPEAAEKLKITATELLKLEICDGIIPEPIGGAHTDPEWTSQQIKIAVLNAMDELTKLSTEELLKDRVHKYRKLGGFQEGIPQDPYLSRNMVKRQLPLTELEEKKLEQQNTKSSSAPPEDLDESIEKLEKEINQELSEADKAFGLTERLSELRDEISKAETIDPLLQDKIEKLKADFKQRLSEAPNSKKLEKKRAMLRELKKAKIQSDRNKKTEILTEILKEKIDGNNPSLKENYEALRSEIQRVGASSGSALDDELKKKIIEFNKEVQLEVTNAAKSIGLNVKFGKPRSSVPEIEELNKDLQKEIDNLANSSPDIKRMREQLRLEVSIDALKPNSESKNRILALRQQIKQQLSEALDSSSLKQKYENLVSKVSEDGSLKAEETLTDNELKDKSKVSENGSFKTEESLTDNELQEKVGANRNVS